jgi:protein-S-isoprenylcysteine O-methyltransferase Ste14
MELFKPLLLTYWLLLLGFAFVLLTYRVYRLTGVNPYKLGNSNSAHDFIGGLFRLVMLLSLTVVVIYALTLLTLVLGDVLMQIQVRLEEEHLERIHGVDYLDYCKRVRQWL